MPLLRRIYYVLAYYLSWGAFAFVGLLLNLVCVPFLLASRRERLGDPARAAIRSLFKLWVRWQHMTGVVIIRWTGFDRATLPPGVVYIANHPSLVDATFLLARLPDAICIFKPRLLRNPAIGPAALLAGYASGDSGVDLIRDAAAKVAAGRSLLIFPEGTRTTPGTVLNPFKPGFALIARRAHAPIRLIHIRAPHDFVPRGRPWWKPPSQLPTTIEFIVDELIPADTPLSPAELTTHAQHRFTHLLSPPS